MVELLSSWRLESAFSSLFLNSVCFCVFGLFSPPRPLAAIFAGQFCVCFSVFHVFMLGSRRAKILADVFVFCRGVGHGARAGTNR